MKAIIIGAGLAGCTAAYLYSKAGYQVEIYESSNTVGGMAATYQFDDFLVMHRYGPHLFHTSNEKVWEFVNRFSVFDEYYNQPKAKYKDSFYSLPFNMNTFTELWGLRDVDEVKAKIQDEIKESNVTSVNSLKDYAISTVGSTIYNRLIKHYTEKQWGVSCEKLPSSIIKRLPLRFEYNNNYFNDTYQAVPRDGYTNMCRKMINRQGITIHFNKTITVKDIDLMTFDKLVITSSIDKLFDYSRGDLEYRSLEFTHELYFANDVLKYAVINQCDDSSEFTRIYEHAKMCPAHMYRLNNNQNVAVFSIITKEKPIKYTRNVIPYYSVHSDNSEVLYKQYVSDLMHRYKDKVLLCGRLSQYKYLNMDEVIADTINQINLNLSQRRFL